MRRHRAGCGAYGSPTTFNVYTARPNGWAVATERGAPHVEELDRLARRLEDRAREAADDFVAGLVAGLEAHVLVHVVSGPGDMDPTAAVARVGSERAPFAESEVAEARAVELK